MEKYCIFDWSMVDLSPSPQDMSIVDAPEPRPDQLPLGASRNTWPNIVNNKVD